MRKSSRIFVAGQRGFLGSALQRKLKKSGYLNCVESKEPDFFNEKSVLKFFQKEKPENLFIAVQKSGGISANIQFPGNFIHDNLVLQSNILTAAAKTGVKKTLFFGASCIYPSKSAQPIKEHSLYRGELEATSKPYAVSKIAGLEMCRAYKKQFGMDYVVIVPATVYGPGGNFDAEQSHVISALMLKFHEAVVKKFDSLIVWGSGNPRREFVYIDDLVNACVLSMISNQDLDVLNVGPGTDISIRDLSFVIKKISGFQGHVQFDKTRPDGVLRKLLDSSRVKELGWHAKVSLSKGIRQTYNWFKNNQTLIK